MKETLSELKKELRTYSNKEKAKNNTRFFKTGRGDYGEGDKFIGVTVPDIRKVAQKYKNLDPQDIITLLSSPIHEERMTALIIMTLRYPSEKETFFNLYIKNTRYINNWDLVDATCPRIVGDYLLDKPRDPLYDFANSNDLWKKRIAIISTLTLIRNSEYEDTIKISEILLNDTHDLIHKAVGWMLREIGNRSKETEVKFLNEYNKKMPRTMLRYAIERFPERERKMYLKGEI